MRLGCTIANSALDAAFVGGGATILAAVFGFGGVILTIILQGRQSRRTSADNERRKIRAAMYEDAVIICQELSDRSIDLSTDLRIMSMQIMTASAAAECGEAAHLPAARYPALLASYGRFSDAAIKTIMMIETRLIIDPRLVIFRTALNVVMHDTRNIMQGQFPISVVRHLPMDNPSGGIFPYCAPDLLNARAIADLCDQVIDALGDASAYASDMIVALQNLLLGDLFPNPLPPRQPLDPAKRAITLAEAAKLEEWFRLNTAYGVDVARIEAETLARFTPPAAERLDPR